MTPSDIRVDLVPWPAAEPLVKPVRETVFVQEQLVPLDLEWDGLDADCWHVVARDPAGAAVGTARMTRAGHIGRMAVLAPWRGRGIGGALLGRLLTLARERELSKVTLHAQTHAVGFYERLGFRAEGAEFMDAGIPHRAMALQLSSSEPAGAIDPRTLHGAEECAAAAAELIAGAAREVLLATPDLPAALYEAPGLLQAVRAWVVGNHRARLRVLIWEPEAARGSPRFIELARQLSSFIELRVPSAEWEERAHFLLADRVRLLELGLGRRRQGHLFLHEPLRAQAARERFEALWVTAAPAQALRRLHI